MELPRPSCMYNAVKSDDHKMVIVIEINELPISTASTAVSLKSIQTKDLLNDWEHINSTLKE